MAEKSSGAGAASRQALIVAGMHRSGTSAMARLLSLSGANLPERVMDPGPDNPTGYWEPWEMVALDDEILAAVDSSWDNVFSIEDDVRARAVRNDFKARAADVLAHNYGDRDLLVMKDPRSSLLTRFWRDVLVEDGVDPVYVIMVRHPLEVAASLLARNGFPREKSMLLWTSYMLAVERDTRDSRRVFVSYSDLLSDWNRVLDRVETLLGRPLPRRTSAASVEIQRFLQSSQRHHSMDDLELGTDTWEGVRSVHSWMLQAAKGHEAAFQSLDAVRRDLVGLEKIVGPALADIRLTLLKSQADHASAEEELAQTRIQRDAVAVELEAGGRKFADFHAEMDEKLQALQGDKALGYEALAESRREVEMARSQIEALHAEADEKLQAVRADLYSANDALTESRLETAAQQEAAAYWRALQQGETAKVDILTLRLNQALEESRLEIAAQQENASYWRVLQQGEAAKVDILTLRLNEALAGLERVAGVEAYNAALQEHVAGLQDEIHNLRRSTSWRLTRPLRSIIFRLRRLKGGRR